MTASPLLNPDLGVSLTPRPGRVFVLVDKPKEATKSGIIYDQNNIKFTHEGEVFGVGEGVKLDVRFGDRVVIGPMSGASLSVCAPRLNLPDELLEIDEGDILALRQAAGPQGTMSRWPMVYDFYLPPSSDVLNIHCIPDHALIRPYSPLGVHAGGLITTKNEKFPRIWAWILGIRVESSHPDLRPGRMVVYSRFADEVVGNDMSKDGTRELPICIVPVSEIQAVVWDPVPVQPEYE